MNESKPKTGKREKKSKIPSLIEGDVSSVLTHLVYCFSYFFEMIMKFEHIRLDTSLSRSSLKFQFLFQCLLFSEPQQHGSVIYKTYL